jgi:FkbM family methyltransferase
MITKFAKLCSLILLFPLKVGIVIINTIRRLTKSKMLDTFIYNFRTKLQNDFAKVSDSAYLAKHASKLSTKLTYVDIGARGGLLPLVEKNREHFEKIILCEGEPAEANKLRSEGYLVIDKFLADVEGTSKFYYIAGHPGASSLKRPGTPFLHLFSDKHYDIYTKYKEENITTSTLDVEFKKLGVTSLDFIKLDVQGSELSVIKGLNSLSPLFWEIEILPLPTYEDTPYGTSITTELANRGYICLRQSGKLHKDGVYIYSNDIYMPNYGTEFGKKLIRANINQWRLMMSLFDCDALAAHIEQMIK